MNAFWIAVTFLTRLPVPGGLEYSPRQMGNSLPAYPLVGLLLGGILWLTQLGLASHPGLGAALLLMLWAGLTGGLHLDGLADCADAWVGGQGDRERSLGLMKDPRSGPAAIVAVALLLLVKYGALVELWRTGSLGPALLAAPLLARGAIPALLLATPYVRTRGLGSALAENLPRRAASLAAALSLLAGVAALGPWAPLSALLLTVLLRHAMLQWLGGCTGDTLGASVELLEAAILAGAVLLPGWA